MILTSENVRNIFEKDSLHYLPSVLRVSEQNAEKIEVRKGKRGIREVEIGNPSSKYSSQPILWEERFILPLIICH